MTTRLWTALLMLAAVFAMHGLQCTSAADSTDAAHTASVVTPAAAAAGGSHLYGGPTAAMADSAPVAGGHAVADPAAADRVAEMTDAGHGSMPHGWGGHLWTLCLAVLAVGLAVLLAQLAPRLIGLASPALRSARGRARGWLTPPRPPDLSSLCLLRI
jgi:hypothetical protein